MLAFLREGGWGMYPMLILGLIALVNAIRFAAGRAPAVRGMVESINSAVLFLGLTSFVTGLIATGSYLAKHELKDDELLFTMVMGLKESLSNLVLAFGLVCLVHIALAVGRYRLERGGVSTS